MRFEIRHRYSKTILWEGEATDIKDAVIQALKAGANLYGANLYGADLYGANLSGADLSGADLYGADLSGANLYGANLSGANLSGANLYGANLSGANLSGAKGLSIPLGTPLLFLKEQTGPIRLYKLVDANEASPIRTGNRLLYPTGGSVEVEHVDTDPYECCGAGINLCTADWAIKNWKPGYRIKICEFRAEDIACIPYGCEGKIRVRRCTVVGEKDVKEFGLGVEEKPAVEAKA